MSGYTNNMVVYIGALEEEACFIAKPFTSSALPDRVGRMLEPEPCP